jgi:general secretion pathway protein K
MFACLWQRLMRVAQAPRSCGSREAGFILIIVISALGLLALVAANFAGITRSHIRAASATVQSAAAEQLADAGMHLAVLDLVTARLDAGQRRRFAINGAVSDCDAGGGTLLRISLQDEAGKVDLNAADERLLRALLSGSGISAGGGPAIDRILDFRDVDSVRRPDGAERAEYAAASRQQGPKNEPFAVIEELHQVLGFSAVDVALLRPHVTVYARERLIDPTVASAELIGILARGFSELATMPRKGGAIELESEPPDRLPAALAGAAGRRVFSVHAEGHVGRAVFVREAVVEVSGSRTKPFSFLRWHRGLAPLSAPAQGADLPLCWQD